jgi:membrane-associated protease RseP (regulator of RpoE activity)
MQVPIILLLSLIGGFCLLAAEEGVIGITVDRDFKVVTELAPESAVARAGVRAGDQIIAVNGFPTARMQNLEEFAKRVLGAAGSEIELDFVHPGSDQPFNIRIRRMPASAAKPPQVPPGFDAHQVNRDTNSSTNRSSKTT